MELGNLNTFKMNYFSVLSKTNEFIFYKDKIDRESIRTDFFESFRERQLITKELLIREISLLQNDFNRILILGSWYGILQYEIIKYYLEVLSIDYVDIDPYVHYVREDYLRYFSNDFIRHRSIQADAVDYCSRNITTEYDLIICTSLEHFKPFNTTNGPLYALIGNNKDIPDHVNHICSVEQLKEKYNINQTLFEKRLWDSHSIVIGFNSN